MDDPYGREEEQERLAEQKALHRPMRAWYSDARNVKLVEEHGPFPPFWQDLESWQSYRSVRKLFLRFQDTGEFGPSASAESSGDRELYESMRSWYASRAELSSVHGTFPSDADSLQAWPSFKEVCEKFLEDPPKQDKKRRRHVFGDATTVRKRPTETQLVAVSGRSVSTLHEALFPQATTDENSALIIHQPTALSHEQCQELMLLQMRLRTVQERTMNFAAEYEKWNRDPGRPPSPPPIYGPDGKRANTPEVRFRQQLERERADILKAISKLRPQAAAALGEVPKKPTKKLYIPVKEYPNVCFMGLILGPRGNHHKKMEKESGCRIRIRGRGSLREGSRGKDQQRDIEDDKDDLHVYIEGPTDDAVQLAAGMVEPLLHPDSTFAEELKEKHQMELAEINGTARADEYCHICGEKGHRQWECPAKQRSYAMANVRCALCGDTSHPTRDCALNKKGANAESTAGTTATETPIHQVKVDSQFLDFMSELGEDPGLGFKPKSNASLPIPAATLQSVHPPKNTNSSLAPTLQSVHPPPSLSNKPSLAPTLQSVHPPPSATTISTPRLAPTLQSVHPPPSTTTTSAPTLQSINPPAITPAQAPAATVVIAPRPIQFAQGQPAHASPAAIQVPRPWYAHQQQHQAFTWNGVPYPAAAYNPAQAAYAQQQQQQYYGYYAAAQQAAYMQQAGYAQYVSSHATLTPFDESNVCHHTQMLQQQQLQQQQINGGFPQAAPPPPSSSPSPPSS